MREKEISFIDGAVSACNAGVRKIDRLDPIDQGLGKLGELWDSEFQTVFLPQSGSEPVAASLLHGWLVDTYPYAPAREIVGVILPKFKKPAYDHWSVEFPEYEKGERGIVHFPRAELNREVNAIVHSLKPGERRGLRKRVQKLARRHEQWEKDFYAGKWRSYQE